MTGEPPWARPGLAAHLGGILRRSVGLDEAVLARLEGDRRWYTGQILLVAGVATMAATSLTTALTMTTGASPYGWPLAFGAALGGFVAVCDLTIVLPDGQTRRHHPATYAGRVGFSLLMGGLAAMPLTAAIFQRDVDHHEQQARQHAATDAETTYRQTITETRAAVHIAHAPAVAAATAARDDTRRQADDAASVETAQRRDCNDEINGTAGSGLAGQGPRASAKCTAATDLARRAETAQHRAADADAALAAATRDELTDADTKTAALPRPAITPYQPADLGVIDRITRTHDLLGTPATLAVSLTLLALDTLPVILKLTHDTTTYEHILTHRHHRTATDLLTPTTTALAGEHHATAAPLDRLQERGSSLAGTAEPRIAAGPAATLTEHDQLDAFVRARLILDPHIPARDLHALATAAGYPGKYSTFTRYLRTRNLRPTTGPDTPTPP